MNETVYVYIVHSDINENNIYAEFETEEEAIEYARRNKDELTYVDRVEVALDEDGDIIEEVDSETIWVYDEEEDELTDDEIEALIQADEDRKWAEADLGDTTWFEELDTDSLVETLEENEDIVECKECFELFPKEACTKVAIGYICPECGKIHSHEEPEFEIDSIPDVVIADEDTFKIDFPEVERMNYGNDMIPDEPTPEVGPNPEPMTEPCVGPECEAPVEAPITKDETITKLVVDEHEAIDGYEKAKIEIEANSELDEKEKEEILDTIEHIKEEEIEHIEELEELVDEVEETKAEESESEDESEVLVEAYADIDYNDVKHLDRIVARARRYKGKPRKLSAESLAWVFRESTLKHLTNGLADCNSLEDVEKKLDPYFDYLPNSIYNSGVEAYDEIVSVLPEALWELKTGIPVDKEGLDEKLINNNSDTLVEGSGFLGKVILDDYFKKDGQRNPENKNGTGYWVDLIDPDTKQSIIKPEDKKTVQKLKEAETIATNLSKAEAGWAVIRVEGAQGWNGILEVYEKGKRTQDVTQKKLANLNKAWDDQEAKKKARQALDKNLGKDKKDSENIDLPGNTEQQPDEEQNTPNQNEQEVTVKPKNAAAVKANKEYKKIIDALKKIGIATSELSKLVQGKKPTDALKELRKLLFVESLAEHVNEEHPAIESDQELEGIDNAVVDCEVADVITHSEDEKPLDCKMKKAPLEKPLTEDLSEEKLQVMEDYLKSTKFASLDTEWEEEGDFYLDIIGAYLDYSNRTNMFSLGLSIYHASEDNNAEYPERHTDEEEFSYDSLAEMYEDEECKEILDRLYEDNSAKLTKSLTETKCKDCGGELKDNKCTACNRDWNLEKCNRCGGEVKDGKCTHCDYDFTVVHCKACGGEVKDGKCTSCNELVEAHRTGDFVKLVNDKFRTDQPVSVYDLKCWMKSCDLTVKQQGLSKINLIIDFDNNCEIIQETEKAYLVSVPCYFRNPKDRSQILDTPNYIALWAPKSRCVKLDPVTEETHAQYAKPEGNRVQAYNNALKYAKQYNKPFIYGYTNHTGKFFAAETPMKVTGSPAEAEKEFRQQYKNCKVVYVVYPDKTFLNEVLYNFTPEEQAEYGIDEEGQSLEGFDTYVRCNWCGEVYSEFDCKFEANLGWLCPRCQDEVRSHGGPLTIVEEPSEEQIQATLEN